MRHLLWTRWGPLCAALLGLAAAPAQAGETPEPLSPLERRLIGEAMLAFEIRIDPDYYLSGAHERAIGTASPQERQRWMERMRQLKERDRHLARQERLQEQSRARHARLLALQKREREARHAAWRAQRMLDLRHRCNSHQRNVAHSRAQAVRNPNYVHTPIPAPPGC